MRRLIAFSLTLLIGVGIGYLIGAGTKKQGADQRRSGYPDYIEIQQPAPPGAGKMSVQYKLQIISANEDGWPITIADGREGQPSWKLKITRGSDDMTLFAQEVRD